MKDIAVRQPASQVVTVFMLGVMLMAGAGTLCFLPVVPASPHSSCHPVRVPTNPQPADYQCCASRHAAALLTNVFAPRPALQALAADAVHVAVTSGGRETFQAVFSLSNGPPGLFVLRI